MVFMLILIGIFLVTLIVAVIIDEEDIGIFSFACVFITVLIFFGLLGDSISTKNSIKDIRANPQAYSVFEKHDMNKDIKRAKKMYGTIFSFYNGFDLDYLDETI